MSLEQPHHHPIELLVSRYVPGAGHVWRQAFPESILTALGRGFVEDILGSFVSQDDGLGYVCLCGDTVVGFVVGAENVSRHRSALLRRAWAPLLIHVLRRLAISPSLAWRLTRYAGSQAWSFRRLVSQDQAPAETRAIPPASLVLLGVATDHRRQGIADRLTHAFLQDMARRGVGSVKLAVAVSNEPAVAFYLSRGWQQAGTYPSVEGGSVYRLIYDLAPLRSSPTRQ